MDNESIKLIPPKIPALPSCSSNGKSMVYLFFASIFSPTAAVHETERSAHNVEIQD
jgi:hypothetical protein